MKSDAPNVVETKLNFHSQAMFHPGSWLQEGDGLLVSARSLRALWAKKRQDIRRTRPPNLSGVWPVLTGHPTASMLLVGYAIEVYLKAGLAKWLQGCSEKSFKVAVLQYGHKYRDLADALEIPEPVAPRRLLAFLEAAVRSEGRYPAEPAETETPVQAINRRTSRMWSRKAFGELRALARGLREYVQRMNGDSQNPAEHGTANLGGGGYLVFRTGGHLPSRVTCRPPHGETWSLAEIENWLRGVNHVLIRRHWMHCDIYVEDGAGKTKRLKQGQSYPPAAQGGAV
jgi:hypothetical protein